MRARIRCWTEGEVRHWAESASSSAWPLLGSGRTFNQIAGRAVAASRLGILLLAATLCWAGCSDDDGNGNDNGNTNSNGNGDEVCGNGKLDPGEQCDDGDRNSDTAPDACRTDCRSAFCGDGVNDSGEVCDGDDLADTACADLQGFDGGQLACAADCQDWDTSNCARCGNDVREGAESCDGSDFGGASCASLSAGQEGILVCSATCDEIRTGGCYTCGNDQREGPEECDGADLGGETCQDHGFAWGKLACDPLTCALDTSGCHSVCGNGVIEDGEDCEGTDLGGASCSNTGFYGGDLRCSPSCQYSYVGCTDCGDGTRDGNEECDGSDFGGEDCASLTGSLLTGTPSCTSQCRFDLSACSGAPATCGNDVREGSEQCDGWDLGGADCASLYPTLYGGGTLTCTGACAYDTQHCTPISAGSCGDGTLNGSLGEQCDGSELGGETCQSQGFGGGTLACTSACQLDLSGCTAPSTCGDGQVDPAQGEACDGNDLGSFSTCAALGYAGGTLACASNCTLDTSDCTTCGDGVRNGTDECDGSDLGGHTCQSQGFSDGTLTCTAGCIFDTSNCGTCLPEQCNGLDDDCDGSPDDGFACVLGEVDDTCIVPGCGVGERTCESGCVWGQCDIAEVCNGVDDNCNGAVDETFTCELGTTRSCTNSCGTGIEECVSGCTWSGVCTIPEVCNGVDDDCDQAIDEDFECVQNEIVGCTTSCGSFGSQLCSASCTLGSCVPPAETCNLQDDDCDADVDEHQLGHVETLQLTGDTVDTSSHQVSAAWNGSEFGITWLDERSTPSELRFIVVDGDGVAQTPEVLVSEVGDMPAVSDVAWTGNDWGVVYNDADSASHEIKYARFDAAGNRIGSVVTVTSTVGNAYSPRLVWSGSSFGMTYAVDVDRFFTVFDASGSQLVSPELIAVGADPVIDLVHNGSHFGLLVIGASGFESVFQLRDNLGTEVQTTVIPCGGTIGMHRIRRITWSGTDWWVHSCDQNPYVVQLDSNAQIVEEWPVPGNATGGFVKVPGRNETAFLYPVKLNRYKHPTGASAESLQSPIYSDVVTGSSDVAGCSYKNYGGAALAWTGTHYAAVGAATQCGTTDLTSIVLVKFGCQ